MAIIKCTTREHVGEHERIVAECTTHSGAEHVHVISYEGAVLNTGERNGYHDSDFYATVYDREANEVRTIEYASTRFWTYHNSATVDADEATVAAALAVKEPLVRESIRATMEAEAAELAPRRRVEFTRAFNGKKQAKVAKGATGQVFWIGACRFNQHTTRVGVALDGSDERVFVNANILAATETPELDAEELEARIARALSSYRYRFTAQARKAVAA